MAQRPPVTSLRERVRAGGKAYKSFVTEAELERMRAEATARGIKSFRYRGAERDWTPAQVAEAEATGKPFTVRLKTPLEGATSFRDLIRGGDLITVNNSELQDIVLVKSSGMPLYHLAHLIDDHEMHVTHVLRAEEWARWASISGTSTRCWPPARPISRL